MPLMMMVICLWRPAVSVRVPGCQKHQMTVQPGLIHDDFCTHTETVGVKGLNFMKRLLANSCCFFYKFSNSSRTCPLSSSRLLVSLSLSNEMICFIHWAPLAGESGCTWMRPGMCGSGFPATTQLEEWKLYRYRLSSHGTKSIISM